MQESWNGCKFVTAQYYSLYALYLFMNYYFICLIKKEINDDKETFWQEKFLNCVMNELFLITMINKYVPINKTECVNFVPLSEKW